MSDKILWETHDGDWAVEVRLSFLIDLAHGLNPDDVWVRAESAASYEGSSECGVDVLHRPDREEGKV